MDVPFATTTGALLSGRYATQPHAVVAGPSLEPLSRQDDALLRLLGALDAKGYTFATPAPNTHRRMLLRRRRAKPGDLADVFGWSRWFGAADFEPELAAMLDAGGALERRGARLASRLRVSRAGGRLFLHSAFPVRGDEHVFFGPDTYRFIEFIRAELGRTRPGMSIADIGAGAGAGGVFAAAQTSNAQLLMTDVNREALRLARVNARFAGVQATLRCCEGLPPDAGPFDLIVANPPYISGSGLTYSDGGEGLGSGLTIAWTKAAVSRLKPGGRLLLYSGSAIVDGHDALRDALADIAGQGGCAFAYRELDPDVFPAQLLHPNYWSVERIAAIGAVVARPAA